MLHRRSIRLRIVTLVLVPVLALIGLYAVVLDLTLGDFLALQKGQDVQQQITTPVSNLQKDLTIERALALTYMANPRRGALPTLLFAEHHTDRAARAFQAAAAATLAGASPAQEHAIRTWQADLATLTSLRSSVASIGISRADALGAYSNIITDGNNVTTQVILPLVTSQIGVVAIDVINLNKAAETIAEEADLIRADLIARTFPGADLQLFNQLVVLHREIYDQSVAALDPQYQKFFKTMIPQSASAGLTALENDVLVNGVPKDKLTALQAWTTTVGAYAGGLQAALVESGNALNATARAQLRDNLLRLILTGGLGLVAILVGIGVGITISRGLVRQLNNLRLSALEMSGQRLPSVIERLRAGEEVDVAAEAPNLEPGTNEIGQVRQAFNALHQTAIAAAVDESRIRRGVNDVFRNLARRNQSLLTRQLQLLDAMERRIHDPEELADLFRIDHLTTRMRRHAEGLLIVAGGSSGRTWREPVPIVDVMRAAVAEVEDYTRIRVMSRTGAAVAGHAVADVIHLLAELLENATIFSPANTPVRVDGDMVARGLAVEIEDRGLGMREEQVTEINRKLADPPLFDLSGSDQLGLYIAGQLARRHDIKITLRTSAYGGTTAVVLIPRALVLVSEEEDPLSAAAVRELGGRPIPQLLAALPNTAPGTGATAEGGMYGLDVMAEPDDAVTLTHPAQPAIPASPVVSVPTLAVGWPDIDSASAAPRQDAGAGQPQSAGQEQPAPLSPSGGSGWSTGTIWDLPESDTLATVIGASSWPAADSAQAQRADHDQGAAAWPSPKASQAGHNSNSSGHPWAALDGGTSSWPAFGADAGQGKPSSPFAASPGGARLPRRPPAAMAAVIASSTPDQDQPAPVPQDNGEPKASVDTADLPVRVRQASLAPQLRDQVRQATPARSEPAAATEPTGPSPEAARNTMAALQRGWERGRSIPVDSGAQADAEPGADGQPNPADRQESNGMPHTDGQPKGDSK